MTPSQRALVGAVVFVGCGPEPTPREPVDVHLVRVGDTVYEYDESGHLVDPSFRWDGDQLTAICPGGYPPCDSLEYDGQGRLVSRRTPARYNTVDYEVVTTLTYDDAGRLARWSVHSPALDSSLGTPGLLAQDSEIVFRYDQRGRLVGTEQIETTGIPPVDPPVRESTFDLDWAGRPLFADLNPPWAFSSTEQEVAYTYDGDRLAAYSAGWPVVVRYDQDGLVSAFEQEDFVQEVEWAPGAVSGLHVVPGGAAYLRPPHGDWFDAYGHVHPAPDDPARVLALVLGLNR